MTIRNGVYFILFFLFSGCGKGTVSAPNDPAPTGTIVAQGQFAGLNSKSVSGVAVIYQTGSSYVARLEGISVPNEAGLQVVVKTSTTTVLQTTLRNISGTQNYSFSVSDGAVTWSSVTIHSTATNLDYGTALLK